MKKITISATLLLFALILNAQVGIGNTDPKAQLDISAGSTASEKDGILIPRLNEFPTGVNADQDGMLVFLTGVGAPEKGFYYYDSNTTSWVAITNASGGTLDDAYDFGGAGNGSVINATNGTLTINGTDGLIVLGQFGSGSTIPQGNGTLMYYNPRKGAFRAGVANPQFQEEVGIWNDAQVGDYSFAGGFNTRASGISSTAFGYQTSAEANNSFAIGYRTISSGENSLALGNLSSAEANNSVSIGHNSLASETNSIAIGDEASATGINSMAIGTNVESPSFGETVIGQYNSIYSPVSATDFEFADRLFSVGGGFDLSGTIIRRNALTIFKNGNININEEYNLPNSDGSNGQVLTTNGNGLTYFANITGDGTGTDNQNLTTPTLSGSTLNLGIEDGVGTSVDLKPITQILKNPSYPDGFENISPITLQFIIGSYTVPTGKNLYITNAYINLNGDITIDGNIIKLGLENTNGYQQLEQPIVAAAGSVIDNSCFTCAINGFLTDALVTPITIDISSNYIVPTDKIFVILSAGTEAMSFVRININGIRVYDGLGNNSSAGNPDRRFSFKNPLFADEGDTLSSSSTTILNGYLIDK